jgi:hypothetical protein
VPDPAARRIAQIVVERDSRVPRQADPVLIREKSPATEAAISDYAGPCFQKVSVCTVLPQVDFRLRGISLKPQKTSFLLGF